jgi:hypothetical protein
MAAMGRRKPRETHKTMVSPTPVLHLHARRGLTASKIPATPALTAPTAISGTQSILMRGEATGGHPTSL